MVEIEEHCANSEDKTSVEVKEKKMELDEIHTEGQDHN